MPLSEDMLIALFLRKNGKTDFTKPFNHFDPDKCSVFEKLLSLDQENNPLIAGSDQNKDIYFSVHRDELRISRSNHLMIIPYSDVTCIDRLGPNPPPDVESLRSHKTLFLYLQDDDCVSLEFDSRRAWSAVSEVLDRLIDY